MPRATSDGGGPSGAIHHHRRPAAPRGTELAQRVLLHWRVRCLIRRAPLRATAGSDALALCAAVLWTLDHGARAPGLALAGRRWAEGVATASDTAQALDCLAEVVTEIAAESHATFPSDALGEILDLLAAEAAAVAARRTTRPAVDALTGCGDRRALERDLDAAVAAAMLGDALDLSVAVVELERSHTPSARRGGRGPGSAHQAALRHLVSVLGGTLGQSGRLYRIGVGRLAVLAPRSDSAALGEVMLRACCAGAPLFIWGAASLRSSGGRAIEDPDALVVLAEANLHIRRRDLVHARVALARHRRRTVVGSVAGALVLLAGAVLGVGANAPAVHVGRSALGAPVRSGPGPQPSPAAEVPVAHTPAPDQSGSVLVPAGGQGLSAHHQSTGSPAPTGGSAPSDQSAPSPPSPSVVDQVVGTVNGLTGRVVGI